MTSLTDCSIPFDPKKWIDFLEQSTYPMLTWHEPQRVELSGPVIAKWLSKVINYRLEEFGEDELTAQIELPAIWQGLIWVLGLNMATTEVLVASEKSSLLHPQAQLLISDNLETLERASSEGIVALAQRTDPLNMASLHDLPAMVEDGAAGLMTQSDTPLAFLEPSETKLPWVLPPANASRGGCQTIIVKPQMTLSTITHEVLAAWQAGDTPLLIDSDLDVEKIIAQESWGSSAI